ncbi:MAG: hypothetical protein LQ350_008375 [Teloschistes chrysophthalmus]|nr:MAG: hypothetical protein LQ350_008375 [Niorma chrysophthalma]
MTTQAEPTSTEEPEPSNRIRIKSVPPEWRSIMLVSEESRAQLIGKIRIETAGDIPEFCADNLALSQAMLEYDIQVTALCLAILDRDLHKDAPDIAEEFPEWTEEFHENTLMLAEKLEVWGWSLGEASEKVKEVEFMWHRPASEASAQDSNVQHG